MNNINNDLEPCPLCGSNDVIVAKDDWSHTYAWGIMCNACRTEYKLDAHTMKIAVKIWNYRRRIIPKRMCANCIYFDKCCEGLGNCTHIEHVKWDNVEYDCICELWESVE